MVGKSEQDEQHADGPGGKERTSPAAHVSHAGLDRRDVILLGSILLVAFGLRLLYIWQLRDSPLFDQPEMDELYHDQWGRAIAAGETFVEGPYFRAPLYPAFLGAVFKVFGHGYLAPRVIQALLGALSCGLLFLIGRSFFGRAVGAVAGFVAASYWMLIYFDGELLIPSLIVFLDLLLIWLLRRATLVPRKTTLGLAGAVLGLSAIARPNVLLFGPAIVIWLAVVYRREWRRAVGYIASMTAGCLLVVLPVTVRNLVVGDDLVLVSSQGGVNFYIGNNPDSDGVTAVVPGTNSGWWEGYYETIERAERARGQELKPSEVSQYYYGEAWDFILRQPAEFLALTARKFHLFWSRLEVSNNKGIYFWTERFTPIVALLPLGFGIVGPLGIVGLVLCWRRRRELFPLWGFVLVYTISVVAFFFTSRYRTPVLPPLILLGTFAMFQGLAALRQARWVALLGGTSVLTLAAVFTSYVPFAAKLRNDAQSRLTLGNVYEQQGRFDLAAEHLLRAVEIDPGLLMARNRLGTTLAKMGRLPEAIEQLRHALTLSPRLSRGETEATIAAVHNNLANALLQSGAPTEAEQHYRAALELYPPGERANTLLNLGRTLCGQGRYEEALIPLRECVQLRPDDLVALDILSFLLIQFGHYEEVDRLLRGTLPLASTLLIDRLAFFLASCPDETLRNGAEALRFARQACPQPESCGPRGLDTLAAALAETGRFEEAVDTARRALELARASPSEEVRVLIESIAERLALYETGRAYRLP